VSTKWLIVGNYDNEAKRNSVLIAGRVFVQINKIPGIKKTSHTLKTVVLVINKPTIT
jgi:hypothetical protein